MRFNSEAYEKAFPRVAPEAKRPEIVKPGNVLEEADKVAIPEQTIPENEPENTPEPETSDPEGGAIDGA